VKDSVRDTYIMAVGAVYEDELMGYKEQLENGEISDEEYNLLLTDVFNRCDQKTVDKVEDFLIDLRENLYYFEVDNAKTDILKGRIDLYLAWSGDAVYAMDCGEEKGVDINLGYVVPESGSNIWFDGFVMPKTVSDSQAKLAIEFLNYLSRPESAVRNMEYIGYSSVISGDADEPFTLSYLDEDDEEYTCEYTGVLDWVIQNYGVEDEEDEEYVETVDLSYFFGEEGEKVYSYDHGRQLYGLYSDTETIKRCIIMKTFDEEASKAVDDMWKNVKFVSLSTTAMIVVASVLGALIVTFIILKYSKGALLRKATKIEKNKKF
ncbi:MAG: extracellular solute-binding protein, partial [Firmicutes bacterium]|nr:extracellular solute-binding protein [Candidatus Caballimonas caccae]